MCDQLNVSDQPAHTRSLIRAFASLEYSLTVMLLTEQHLEFLIFRGGCTGLTESTHVKMPPCWKSLVAAIGVAPITQLRTCVIKLKPFKGGHLKW